MSIDSPPLAPSRLRQAVLRLRMGPCALKPASSDGIEVFLCIWIRPNGHRGGWEDVLPRHASAAEVPQCGLVSPVCALII